LFSPVIIVTNILIYDSENYLREIKIEWNNVFEVISYPF